MKRRFLFMFGAILLALSASARDFSYTYEGQTLIYTVLDEDAKTCKTRDYLRIPGGAVLESQKISGSLIIPAIAMDGDDEYAVIEIGEGSFFDSKDMTSVIIPNSVISIGDWAFIDCKGLIHVTVGDSVTEIGDDAFNNCINLITVTFGESLTLIGVDAFGGCESLKSVEIPNSVQVISQGAFIRCPGLESVTLGESVTEIGAFAFYECSSLKSIIIPNSVTKIGFQAFYGCISLLTVYCESEEPIIGDDGLFSSSTYSDATLYVPVASVDKYREVSPWKNFTNIEGRNFSDIDAVAADIEMANTHEVYNLGGVRVSDSVDGLAPGIYIVRQGNKVKKIAVK